MAEKPLKRQTEINLFLSASPKAASSTGGKAKYFIGT